MKDYNNRFRREAILEYQEEMSKDLHRKISLAEISRHLGIIRINLDNYLRKADDPKKTEPKFSTILRMIERTGKPFEFWVAGGIKYEI